MLVYLALFIPFCSFSQGSSCGTAIPIPLDGVNRTYTISSSTGGNVVCSSTGSSSITYFSFTTNSSAQCVLLNITGPSSQPMEVAMYAGGSCTGGNLESTSSMCFADGQGIWAPAESYNLQPGTTYILRIKTAITGSLQIGGQHISPSNNDCLGATPIGVLPVADNNACNKGSTIVAPSQLCAFSLENTSFYSYTVASPGATSVYIENITCDNGDGNNSNGFQIGFFTGTCSSLSGIGCSSNSGSTVTASTGVLAAGTKVYVGIDGVSGANCSYTLRATNVQALPIYLKYFSGWKTSAGNYLKWTTLREIDNLYFDIQRSTDGVRFVSIGRIPGEMDSDMDKTYTFEDNNPPTTSFYRLMQTDIDGKTMFSNIILINRETLADVKFDFANPITDGRIRMVTNFSGKVEVSIMNSMGQVLYQNQVYCNKGVNQIYRNFANLPDGKYIITAFYNNNKSTRSFIKTRSAFNSHQ